MDAPDSVVASDWDTAVEPPAGGVGKPVYQLICFCPTSGMLDPLARPYDEIVSTRVNKLEPMVVQK